MQALPKLGELPLTEIPDIKKTVHLGLSREQAQFLQEFFKLMQATVHEWDIHFNDVERGIVANLQHCLAAEEEACEEEYRKKAEDSMSGSFVILGLDDLVSRRIKVLWAMQQSADQEAGQATPVALIRPFNLLDARQLAFIKERHLKYVTAIESPENRGKSQLLLKKLTNIELRQRYLDICRKRLLGTAAQHTYLPTAPAAYAAHDISWEQLAFEWLETRYDALYHPEYIQDEGTEMRRATPETKSGSDALMIGLLYRWSQTAFLASACDICFLFEEQKEQWNRGVKALPKMEIKTIVKDLQSIKESLEKGKVLWGASTLKQTEWRQFLSSWRLLRDSLSELKQVVEEQKAALTVASLLSPKKASPPPSPARALPSALTPNIMTNSRPASLDTRQELGSPRLAVASPRRQLFSPRLGPSESESALSPRPRASTGASKNIREETLIAATSSTSGRTPPIPIPPLKKPASKGLFPGSLEPHSPDSQSPGRGRKGSGSLANLLKRVDSQFNLKLQSPRKANKLLTNFCAALETEIAIVSRIEAALQPSLSAASKNSALPASPAAISQTVLIFDSDPQAMKNAAQLLELLQFAEQVCRELCEQFDLRKPLQFVSDFDKELERQQKVEDRDILGKLQEKQKEFWEQNRLLLRYHHDLFEGHKKLKPQDQNLEHWQSIVKKNQDFQDFHKMGFPPSTDTQRPGSKEIEQLINRWKDVSKENKLLSEHYKEQLQKTQPMTLEEQMDEVVERVLDMWAFEAFEFQRKYAMQKGYSIRKTLQLLESDLCTPCPDRALSVMCNRKRFTQEAVTMTPEELKTSIQAKSWLGFLKLQLGVGTIDRETPEYDFAGSLLAFVKQKTAPIKSRVPFLAEQIREDKKIRFTFPVNQVDRIKELSGLQLEESFYLEGNELAELYAMLQQLRDQLLKHQTFGPVENGEAPSQPLEKILDRLTAIQEGIAKAKAEKPEVLAQQELVWDQYVSQTGTHQRMHQRLIRDNLRKGTELVSRYLGNLVAFMKARAKPKKGGSQIKAEKQAKRRSNFEPLNLRASFGQLLGLAKAPEPETQTTPPDKLRRKIIKRIVVALPPLANAVFTLPPPGTGKK